MQVTSYEQAGVNVEMGDAFVGRLKKIIHRPRHQHLKRGAGGYAAVSPVTDEKWIALTTDGVGTKVLLAQEFEQHHTVGIDLVAMCANDLICVGATPTLFLDYFATGKLSLEQGLALIEGIVAGCDQAGMILVGGETAEMPDVYQGGHYDLAGFALGELTPSQLITGEAIHPGQKLIGIASSGIHSNGLSLARKVLTSPQDRLALLTPTQIYVKPIMTLLKEFSSQVTGLCHITGGGWRNLFRLNPAVGYHISSKLPLLGIYQKLLASGIHQEEAYKTFNMGMGLTVIASGDVTPLVTLLNSHGLSAQVIGEVTDRPGILEITEEDIVLVAEKISKGEGLL